MEKRGKITVVDHLLSLIPHELHVPFEDSPRATVIVWCLVAAVAGAAVWIVLS